MKFKVCHRCKGTGLRLEKIREENDSIKQLFCILCAARYDQKSLINKMRSVGSETQPWMYVALSRIHDDIRILTEKEL